MRVLRWLAAVIDDYQQNLGFGERARISLPEEDLHPTTDDQLAKIRLRLREVKDVASTYGKRPSPTDTQVVEEAIRKSVADARGQARLITRWRTSSAAAHGLLWHHFGKIGTNAADPQVGVALITVGGHLERSGS